MPVGGVRRSGSRNGSVVAPIELVGAGHTIIIMAWESMNKFYAGRFRASADIRDSDNHSLTPRNSKSTRILWNLPRVRAQSHAAKRYFAVERLQVTRVERKERKRGAFRSQKPLRLIRHGEVGGSGILYLTPTRYTVTTLMILH